MGLLPNLPSGVPSGFPTSVLPGGVLQGLRDSCEKIDLATVLATELPMNDCLTNSPTPQMYEADVSYSPTFLSSF